MADAADLKSDAARREGSNPFARTYIWVDFDEDDLAWIKNWLHENRKI